MFVRHHLAGGEGVRTLAIKAGAIGIEPLSSLPRGIRAQIPHNVHLHAKTLRDVLSPAAEGLHPNATIREAELDAPVFSCVRGMTFVLVPLPSLELLAEVRILSLHFNTLSASLLDEGWRDGFAARYYYVDVGREGGLRCLRTRMLEPGFEDPATGSAATCLGLYLTLAQEKKATRFQMTQGVEMGRKSVISVETTMGEAGELDQVYLGGTAVVVMQGTLRVDI